MGVAQQHHQHERQASLEQLSPQRRSFTAAALRRGTIKISEPVPVENSGPSPVWPPSAGSATFQSPGAAFTSTGSDSVTDDEDDERSVTELLGTAELVVLANNVKGFQTENPHGRQDSFAAEGQWKNSEGYSKDNVNEMTTERDVYSHARTNVQSSHGPSPLLRRNHSSLYMREDREDQTPDRGSSSAPRSSTNESKDMELRNSAGSGVGQKKRRSGSIRTAFRRMFSKRDKSHGEREPVRPGPRHEYHKSESALHIPRGLSQVDEESLYQRRLEPDEDYLSRTQIDTPRLPFPMNINAPLSSPYKSRKQAPAAAAAESTGQKEDSSPHPRRRRNTLPSIVVGPAEAEVLGKYWTKEEAASSRTEALQTTNVPLESRTPTPLIGLAITSNNGTPLSKTRRKSRSADALHDMALVQQDPFGGKAAEISYWRSAGHKISDSTELAPFNVRQSQAGSIGEINIPSKGSEASYVPNLSQLAAAPVIEPLDTYEVDDEDKPLLQLRAQQKRGSRGSRNSIERASQTTPLLLQESAAINRVDQRLSQIEQNMALLAHSMQALSDRESYGSSTGPARPTTSSASFRLEKPPAPRTLQNPLEQQPTAHRASPALGAGAYPHPLHGNPGPSAQESRRQKQPSPRHVKSAGVLVSRSASLQQHSGLTSSQHRHPRHSPSHDFTSRSTRFNKDDDDIPKAVAVPHDGTSPLPANVSLAQQYHQVRMKQGQSTTQREGVISPTVHNFSTPFPQSPTPVTPPTHMATKGTNSSSSTGSSFGVHTTATGIPPPTFPQPHHRTQSSSSYLTQGILPSQHKQKLFGQPLQPPHLPMSSEDSPTRFVDHLAPLYTALRHERTVRKTLEAQVVSLKRDVYELSNVVAQLVGPQQQGQDDKDDEHEEFWQQQMQNLQQRGSGSSLSGNAFAQAQARIHAEARAQGRHIEVQQDSLMAQYAAALQQEHLQKRRRSQTKSRRLQQEQFQERHAGQRVSWSDEQPLSRQMPMEMESEEGYEHERGGETNEEEEEDDDDDDLYERSGNWVAARTTGPISSSRVESTGVTRSRARRRNIDIGEKSGPGNEGEGDWQEDMF